MESKFQLTLKDAFYILSLVFTVFGGWFSLSFKVTETEIRAQAEIKLLQAEVSTLRGAVAELKSKVENYTPETKRSRK